MKLIKIVAEENGYHDNISTDNMVSIADGWAVIPDSIRIPHSFPVVDITVEGNTVTSMTAGIVPEPALPRSDKMKAERSAVIKAACAEAITGGFDADVLGRGPLHYTLTEIQQRDLQTQYAAGATEALWHDSSRVTHEVYTAAQFTVLFQAGYAYIISCKIRSDWLEQLAHDLADVDKLTEAAAVDWRTVLPEAYQAQCDAQIAAMLGGGNE